MRVKVLAFASVRELIGRELTLELPSNARLRDVWLALIVEFPTLTALAGSTRIARNGRLESPDDPLADGDELALLPPVGGG
jgi:molybdopterin converting factor small subunit